MGFAWINFVVVGGLLLTQVAAGITPQCHHTFLRVGLASSEHQNRIPRVGKLVENHLCAGACEVTLASIQPLHPVPRLDVPEGHIESLKASILAKGYNQAEAVPVFIMPDGQIFAAGGHHRIEAMKQLGESSIPARIYLWENLDPELQQVYRTNHAVLRKY